MEKSFAPLLEHAWKVRDLTLFKALTGGAFDCLNWQHSREFDQFFFNKVKCPRVCPGGDRQSRN